MRRRRLEWEKVDDKTFKLLITEQNEKGEWEDVSQKYIVKSKKYGDVYLFSLKESDSSTYEDESGAYVFYNMHIYNTKTKKFDTVSILAKHKYLSNAIFSLVKRLDKFFIMSTTATKEEKEDKKYQTYVKYTIVPCDEELSKRLENIEHEERQYFDKVSADDIEL